MVVTFDSWIKEVQKTLASMNVSLLDCQSRRIFDFSRQFSAGTSAADAAKMASDFWQTRQEP